MVLVICPMSCESSRTDEAHSEDPSEAPQTRLPEADRNHLVPASRLVLKGTRHYDAAKAYAAGRLVTGAQILLIAEPSNPHDSHAVQARLAVSNEKLGYLARDTAPRYQKLLKSDAVRVVRVASVERATDQSQRQYVRIEVSVELAADAAAHPAGTSQRPRIMLDLPTGYGVYALVNDIEHRSYIGSSIDVHARVKQHFKELGAGRHPNGHLQRDYNAQKGEGFSALLIKRLPGEGQLLGAEARAIEAALRDGQKLYNLTSDGRGRVPRSEWEGAITAPSEPVSEWDEPPPRKALGSHLVRRTISPSSDRTPPDASPEPTRPRTDKGNTTLIWIVLFGIVAAYWVLSR